MILIVLVLIIFAGIAVFLFTFARTVSQEEYMNIYVHNLLLTTLRTDTGYTDANCKLVSDTLACAFLHPAHRCGGTGPACLDLANQTVTEYLNKSENVRKNYRYLLIVESETWGGEAGPYRLEIGDKALETERVTKISANEVIQREGAILGVRLIMAKRRAE